MPNKFDYKLDFYILFIVPLILQIFSTQIAKIKWVNKLSKSLHL